MANPDSEREQVGKTSGRRPLGITLLAIFFVFGGVGFAFGGIQSFLSGTYSYQFYIALVWLATGWGMWKGKGWAWNLLLIDIAALFLLQVVSALTVSTGLPLFEHLTYFLGTLALDLLFLYYATRENVKAFFGKSSIRSEFAGINHEATRTTKQGSSAER